MTPPKEQIEHALSFFDQEPMNVVGNRLAAAYRAKCAEVEELRNDKDLTVIGGRYALAIEIWKILQQRGAWVPRITTHHDNYSDIIVALGQEFAKIDKALEGKE